MDAIFVPERRQENLLPYPEGKDRKDRGAYYDQVEKRESSSHTSYYSGCHLGYPLTPYTASLLTESYTQPRLSMPKTLYMVVEHFKNKDAVPVYRRFRDSGRMAPQGLLYVSSWVDYKFERCYQLMETDDRSLLDEWMAKWSDLADFEVYSVVTSQEAAAKIAPLL